MKRDMRQVNKVWEAVNPKGEWFTYALIGTGKNSYIKTLSNGVMAHVYQHLVGTIASPQGSRTLI